MVESNHSHLSLWPATRLCLGAGPLRSRSHPPVGPRVTARCQPVVFEGKRLDGAVHRNLEEGPRALRLPFHRTFGLHVARGVRSFLTWAYGRCGSSRGLMALSPALGPSLERSISSVRHH